jgi:hypothetical protein
LDDAEFEKWWNKHPEDHGAARLFEQADPIADKILSMQPRTIAGLAVLARAAAVFNPTLWHDKEEDFRLRTGLSSA